MCDTKINRIGFILELGSVKFKVLVSSCYCMTSRENGIDRLVFINLYLPKAAVSGNGG